MHLTHQYNAAYFSGLVQNRYTYHTNTTPLTFLAWYRIDAPNAPIQRRLLFWLGTEPMHLAHQYNPLTFLVWYRIDAPSTPIQHGLLFCLGTESMHLTHKYNAAYCSGLVKNRCTYHTNTTWLTFLAWYRIDAPSTPIQHRLLFCLGTESMHLTHQYNAAYCSGLVQNRSTKHTNTMPLTVLAWYRIDALNTPIQRRLLFWFGTESMHLTHQYNSGLVQNRCN